MLGFFFFLTLLPIPVLDIAFLFLCDITSYSLVEGGLLVVSFTHHHSSILCLSTDNMVDQTKVEASEAKANELEKKVTNMLTHKAHNAM